MECRGRRSAALATSRHCCKLVSVHAITDTKSLDRLTAGLFVKN